MCDDLMNNFDTYIPCTIFIHTQVWAQKNVFFKKLHIVYIMMKLYLDLR